MINSDENENISRLLSLCILRTELCDVFFRVDGKDFDLHNIILSIRMEEYILARKRAGSNIGETGSSPENRIVIENLPGGVESFETIVKFCYADESFILSMENVASLFYAAKYFGMESLSSRIESFLINALSSNELESFNEAGMHLYHLSRKLEEQHSLPDDLSRRCLKKNVELLKARGESFWSSRDKLFSSLAAELDQKLTRSFFEVAEEISLKEVDLANFVSHFLIFMMKSETSFSTKRAKVSAAGDHICEKQIAIQMMVKRLNPTLLPDHRVLELLELNESLFSEYENQLLGFVKSFLRFRATKNFEKMTSTNARQFSQKCTSIVQLAKVGPQAQIALDIVLLLNDMLVFAVKIEENEKQNQKMMLQARITAGDATIRNLRKELEATNEELSEYESKRRFPFHFEITKTFLSLKSIPSNMDEMIVEVLMGNDNWRRGTITDTAEHSGDLELEIEMDTGHNMTLKPGNTIRISALTV